MRKSTLYCSPSKWPHWAFLFWCTLTQSTHGFALVEAHVQQPRSCAFFMTDGPRDEHPPQFKEGDEPEDDVGNVERLIGDSAVVLEDLDWRVEKLRLEEQNTQRFLKAGPRFLPYDECRKWVQAFGRRWTTQQEWENWISLGEKRNAYIPSRPEEYYTSTREWISWEHFLLPDES